LDSLRALVALFMEEGVTPDNACKMFETAQDLLKDKEFALRFIEENAEEVVKSAGWDTLPKERLMTILKDDKLCIDEIELFRGVLRWTVCEVKRQKLDDTLENKKKVLKDVLPCIRFPIMDLKEFATYVQPTQLLETAMVLEIFTYLGGKDKGKAANMPFSLKPRGRARDRWMLDNDLKSNTVNLSNNGRTANNTSSNHSYCQGNVAWSKGKHAWRVIRDSNNSQWLFLGVSRKVSHQHASYTEATTWGWSGASQRYVAAATSSETTNFNGGPIDLLFDADAGTLVVLNVGTGSRNEMNGLPKGEGGLVPHFGPHSAQQLTVWPLNAKDFGNAAVDPSKGN